MLTRLDISNKKSSWYKPDVVGGAIEIGKKTLETISEIKDKLADLEYFIHSSFNSSISDIIEGEISDELFIDDNDDLESGYNDDESEKYGGDKKHRPFTLYLTLDKLKEDIINSNNGSYIMDKTDLSLCGTLVEFAKKYYECVEVDDTPGPWILMKFKVRNNIPLNKKEYKKAEDGWRIEPNFIVGDIDIDKLTGIVIDKF